MVVQGPLDFNLLLGHDYVYAMKAVVSTLFRVMHFPHDGKIVTIDQLSFVKADHHMTPSHQNSLNVPHVLVVPSPSSWLLPIIGKMGGMALAFGHHTRVYSLAYVRCNPPTSRHHVGLELLVSIVLFLCQAR